MNKDTTTVTGRIRLFFTVLDNRWENLDRHTWLKTISRDFSAGLVVAMIAIPMAMGFAIAMGMRPEHGIIAGAIAGIIGSTFGSSKYQLYGPTAAFIPVIAALFTKYGPAAGGTYETAHGFLILASLIAGIILIILGVLGFGKYAKLVPSSIIVGFIIGIALAMMLTSFEDILGIESFEDMIGQDENIKGGIIHNLSAAYNNLHKINIWSLFIGLLTFAITKVLLRVSIFIPGPVIAMIIATVLSSTLLAGKNIILVKDIYGAIPDHFLVFALPSLPQFNADVFSDLLYFIGAIVFISGMESILCSSMADRLANNKKTPFNPDKELFGQGMVQIFTPLVHGFPSTGALARTATSIKAGAQTPLAGYFTAALKLVMAYYLAQYLELIPMACIGGILVWVAMNMIRPAEIKEIRTQGTFELLMMVYTAIMVPATDFLTGVFSALVIYYIMKNVFLNKTQWVKD